MSPYVGDIRDKRELYALEFCCGIGTEWGCGGGFLIDGVRSNPYMPARLLMHGRESLYDGDNRIVMFHLGCWPFKEGETRPWRPNNENV